MDQLPEAKANRDYAVKVAALSWEDLATLG